MVMNACRENIVFRTLSADSMPDFTTIASFVRDMEDEIECTNPNISQQTPKNYQSGMYHKVIMRKACNESARAVLYKFAFSTLQFSKWAREYYDKQREKGKTHSVVVRALSNKWIKVIYKIWRDEIFYEESKKIFAAA